MRRGYLVSTAANSTTPNLGVTKGYAVFYESNSTSTNATAAITSIADSLPPSTRVGQVLDSFELVIASPEVAQPSTQQAAQPAEFTQDTTDDEGNTDTDTDDDGDDNGGDDDNCQNIGGTSCADDYDETADD
jgi:hypothetical protein